MDVDGSQTDIQAAGNFRCVFSNSNQLENPVLSIRPTLNITFCLGTFARKRIAIGHLGILQSLLSQIFRPGKNAVLAVRCHLNKHWDVARSNNGIAVIDTR